MQINPFGFPLGAGTQAASPLAVGGFGFADALGFAIDSGTPVITGLTGSTTMPAHFDAKLSQTLLANVQPDAQPMPAATTLPGLQQPTSLSQLMATAAKIPTAEQTPLANTAAPVSQPVTAQPDVARSAVAQPAPVAVEAAPAALQAPVTTPATAAPTVPPAEIQAETPSTDTAPAKPQKRVRTTAVEADPAQPADVKPVAPAPALAAVVPQPVAAQPQPVVRDAVALQTGGTTAPTKKAVVMTGAFDGAAQGTTGAGTPDFAGAVAPQGGKSGSDANADGQPQPEFVPGTAVKHDAAAPVAAHTGLHGTSIDAARAAAPAAPAPAPHAEPVIDARSHLGQSLGVEIAKKVELGEETLRIRLNPIELGRIEVTLAFDDKGALQATVRTDSAQTMDLLRQDMPDLARTLDQAGVRTDTQSFRFENRGGSDGNGQQAQQQHSPNRGRFASSDDDALAAEPIYRPVRSDGQVDLLA